MADADLIAASVDALLGDATSMGRLIAYFVKKVRDSRRDLAATAAQLAELSLILEVVGDDLRLPSGEHAMAGAVLDQLRPMLDSCHAILAELDELLTTIDGGTIVAGGWAASLGQGKVRHLNGLLASNVRTLSVLEP